MLGDMRKRVTVLLVGAAFIAAAVVVRVWLAATGGYSESSLAVPLRIGSAVALVVGFLLAGAAVAWPMQRPKDPRESHADNTLPKKPLSGGA